MSGDRGLLHPVEWVVVIAVGAFGCLLAWSGRLAGRAVGWWLLFALTLLVLGGVAAYGLVLLESARSRRRIEPAGPDGSNQAARSSLQDGGDRSSERVETGRGQRVLAMASSAALLLILALVAGAGATGPVVAPSPSPSAPVGVPPALSGNAARLGLGLVAVGSLLLLLSALRSRRRAGSTGRSLGFRGLSGFLHLLRWRNALFGAGGLILVSALIQGGPPRVTLELPELAVALDPSLVLPAPGARLEELGTTQSFETAKAELGSCEDLGRLRGVARRDEVQGVLLVGHADQRTFRGLHRDDVKSNLQLARRRAEWVADCLQGLDSEPVILVSGPLNGGTGLEEEALAEDRKVDVYGFVAAPGVRGPVLLPVVWASGDRAARRADDA